MVLSALALSGFILRCSPDKTLQVNDEVTNIGLGFSALGRVHNTRSTLRWLNELATVSVSAATVSERSGFTHQYAQESLGKEVES